MHRVTVKEKPQDSAAVGSCSAVFRQRVRVPSVLPKASRFTAVYLLDVGVGLSSVQKCTAISIEGSAKCGGMGGI